MPTTITGNVKTLLGVAVISNCFVRFYLRGCNGAQARVSGTALIPPANGTTWYIDIVPDGSGALSGSAYSNDVDIDTTLTPAQHPTWYGVVIFQNGIPGPETPYNLADGATFNLNSAAPLTTIPAVSPPTGDATYVRIDGANINVTMAIPFSATPVFALPGSPTLLTIFTMPLTGNVTSFTLTGSKPGLVIFKFTQDVSGGHTVAFPSNVKGFQSMDTTANAINSQMGYFDGTNLYAIGPQTVN